MAEQYTSIQIIMDKLMRNPLLSDLTLETVVDYTVDFMRIVGVPKMFIDRIAGIPISEYKGRIPSDWVDTIQVKFNDRPMRYSTDIFHLKPQGSTVSTITNSVLSNDAFEKIIQYYELHSMDDIAMSDGSTIQIQANVTIENNPDLIKAISTQQQQAENTFVIQGGYIYTSMPEGIIYMAYRAIAADNDGYPVIPDNSDFTRALMAYIKIQHYTIMFDLGRLCLGSRSL